MPLAVGHRFDQVAVAYVAGKGRRPEENQDSFWPRAPADGRRPIIEYLTAGRLYIVTDGVSGGLRPQEAARLTADTIGQEYYRLTEGWTLGRDPMVPLRAAVMAAHEALIRRSDQLREQEKITGVDTYMQSTCVCVLILGDSCYTAHVGDSRAYLWRDGSLHQLTQDHTDANGQVNRLLGAELTQEQVTVTRCAIRGLETHIPYRLQAGDRLLLCSDGVHRFLSEQRITKILNRREGLASTAGDLADAVYELGLGNEDDIALILIGIEYDPRRLEECERRSASSRMTRQWREAIALAEEVAWWQPDFGAPQFPIVGSLADLYIEAARLAFERDRDEPLGMKMLENAARLGSAQGDHYRSLAASYLKAASRWRARRGQVSVSPEKEQAVQNLLAIAGQVAELFGPQALAMACEAALELGEELHKVGRMWDALWHLAWTQAHLARDEECHQQVQALATEIRQELLAGQAVGLRQALQAAQGPRPQDGQELLAAWRQACRALLATTDPSIQDSDLARQMAEAQHRLHERLVKLGHGQALDAMYEEDVALFWRIWSVSPPREPGAGGIAPQDGTDRWAAGTRPVGKGY